MNLPPMNTLRAFEATARLGSLSRASQEMGVTHAAISQQIKQLETWFGCRLFERTGRGVMLTGAGRDFHQAAEAALKLIATAAESLRNVRNATHFTVGCIPSVASRWLIPYLQEFLSAHPRVDVRVIYAHGHQQFDLTQYDALISLHEPKDPRLVVTPLLSGINRPIASAHYLEKHPELRTPDGLRHAPLLHDETVQSWTDWFAAAEIERADVGRGPVYQDFNLLAEAVLAGQGIGLCPVALIRRQIASGTLVVLSEVSILDDVSYNLITPKDVSAHVRAFANWIVRICRNGSAQAA